jgi:nucleoid-associated protein YgaU
MFKKSSTAILLTLALAIAAAFAQQQPDPRVTGNVLELAPGAPDSYTVQKGDTLWDIAAKFLKEPWRWPQIWRLNKDQIRNPHLIYPGEVVRLDRSGPTLAIERAPAEPGTPPDVRPRIRAEGLAADAIPTIPLKAIEPFLAQPLVIERGGLDSAPKIVATQEGRYNVGAGSRAYVDGFGDTKQALWQVFRPGIALVDPDTDELLGYEAIYLGAARLTRTGQPATVQILSSTQEITTGDRLVVAAQPQVFAYAPRAPEKPIRGRIMSIYGGVTDARTDYYRRTTVTGHQEALQRFGGETGNLAIVTINRGAKHGVEPGHVLAISRSSVIFNDRSVGPYYMGEPRTAPFPLPEERYGLMMVFRVFENLSYALTLGVERPVAPGDFVTTP